MSFGITSTKAFEIIEAAASARMYVTDAFEDYGRAQATSFARPAPENGVDYVAELANSLGQARMNVGKVWAGLDGTGTGSPHPSLVQAERGMEELRVMQELVQSGGVPFNFTQQLDGVSDRLNGIIRRVATDALRASTTA